MLRFVVEQAAAGRRLARREWLRLGGWGLGALCLPPFGQLATRAALAATSMADESRAKAPHSFAARDGFGRARSVIFVYLSGGLSQLDSWDPKPEAPDTVRSVFAPIATRVPGTYVCEHLPRLAQLADRYTLLRSLSHDDTDHGSATYLTLTGRFHARKSSNPPPSPLDQPTHGAVLTRVRPTERFPATAATLNGPALVPMLPAAGQFAGFLGPRYEPLVVPEPGGPQPLAGLDPLDELPVVRMRERLSLKQELDRARHDWEAEPRLIEASHWYRQAIELLASDTARAAFDLSREPAAVRARYGEHRQGRACLLARRLVEAGVPLVTVIWSPSNRGQDERPDETDAYGWDTHNDIFTALRDRLFPRFDQSLSALLEDLDARGLLDSTLVVAVGEFGRAPTIALEQNFAGSSPGRKHWANAYSALFAGAGVARGAVVGATDRLGGSPVTRRYNPTDLAATLYWALGLDPAIHFTDDLGRTFPLATGAPIAALYGGSA